MFVIYGCSNALETPPRASRDKMHAVSFFKLAIPSYYFKRAFHLTRMTCGDSFKTPRKRAHVSSHQYYCHETDSGETRERTKCKVRELCRASVRHVRARDLREFYIPRHGRDDPSFTRVRLTKVSSLSAVIPRLSAVSGLTPNFGEELHFFFPPPPVLLRTTPLAPVSARGRSDRRLLARCFFSSRREKPAGMFPHASRCPAREQHHLAGEYENPAKQRTGPLVAF